MLAPPLPEDWHPLLRGILDPPLGSVVTDPMGGRWGSVLPSWSKILLFSWIFRKQNCKTISCFTPLRSWCPPLGSPGFDTGFVNLRGHFKLVHQKKLQRMRLKMKNLHLKLFWQIFHPFSILVGLGTTMYSVDWRTRAHTHRIPTPSPNLGSPPPSASTWLNSTRIFTGWWAPNSNSLKSVLQR